MLRRYFRLAPGATALFLAIALAILWAASAGLTQRAELLTGRVINVTARHAPVAKVGDGQAPHVRVAKVVDSPAVNATVAKVLEGSNT